MALLSDKHEQGGSVMRKLLILFTVLCLLGASVSTEADQDLAAAFEALSAGDCGQSFRLEPVPQPDVSDMEIWCAASARELMTTSGLQALRESEDGKLLYLGTGAELGCTGPDDFFVTDISPRGNVMYGMLQGYTRACITDNKVILQTYSAERSTPDTFGTMDVYNRTPNLLAVTKTAVDGVVWSPDGRMAALTNGPATLDTLRLNANPFIIMDVEAGEYYNAMTSDTGFKEGNAYLPLSACFDDTGRYVYFLVYRLGLIEHDTVTRANRLVGSSVDGYEKYAYAPYLSRLDDGRIVFPIYMTKNEPCGIGIYTPVENKVELPLTPDDFPDYTNITELSGEYEFTFLSNGIPFPLRGLDIHAESGLGAAYVMIGDNSFLITLDAYDEFAGIDRLIGLGEDGTPVSVSYEELADRLGSMGSLFSVTLSPDGKYALLSGKESLYVCEPDTLSILPVAYPDRLSAANVSENAMTASSYRRGMDWQSDNLIITSKGMYRLVWDAE